MDEDLSCSGCHQPVNQNDYFCHECGKKLRSPPLSTSISSQIWLYIKTLLLPPLGLIWGFRYLRQPDTKSKLIGWIAIIITIIETIWLIQTTVKVVNDTNQQINQQMRLYGL
jgi:hypothetical protein